MMEMELLLLLLLFEARLCFSARTVKQCAASFGKIVNGTEVKKIVRENWPLHLIAIILIPSNKKEKSFCPRRIWSHHFKLTVKFTCHSAGMDTSRQHQSLSPHPVAKLAYVGFVFLHSSSKTKKATGYRTGNWLQNPSYLIVRPKALIHTWHIAQRGNACLVGHRKEEEKTANERWLHDFLQQQHHWHRLPPTRTAGSSLRTMNLSWSVVSTNHGLPLITLDLCHVVKRRCSLQNGQDIVKKILGAKSSLIGSTSWNLKALQMSWSLWKTMNSQSTRWTWNSSMKMLVSLSIISHSRRPIPTRERWRWSKASMSRVDVSSPIAPAGKADVDGSHVRGYVRNGG